MNNAIFRRAGWMVGLVALVATVFGGVWTYSYNEALGQLNRNASFNLTLAADRMTRMLEGHREIAVLMADHPAIRGLLAGEGSRAAAAEALLGVADKTGALDVLVLGKGGAELISARDTPVQDHQDSAYFQRALDGALGISHFYVPRYLRRAFVLAAPVFSDEGPVAGAVLVVADVEGIEAGLRANPATVLFTDDQGVVFASNRSELVFLTKSASESGGQIGDLAQFRRQVIRGHDLWDLDKVRYLPQRALHLTIPLPIVGLTAEILDDLAPARRLAFLQAAAAAALCFAFGALLILTIERRRTLSEANARLESRVSQRTTELLTLNRDLRHEVAERSAAEDRLTKAQGELVQAGKLAALGQMSAGISHELNQPLMAIRSFAENAELYLAKGQPEAAAQNLGRISDLARRMGRIIRNLRAFARQESEPIGDVDLVAVVNSALEMLGAKQRQVMAEVEWSAPDTKVMVRGGEVRLQQVVLNLVSNALDAMAQSDTRRLTVSLDQGAEKCVLTVQDTGPGIAEPEKVFDPFYSTKQVGESEGMGLGLSISYGLVQSFGGQIRGYNAPEGGAIFTVELASCRERELT